MDRTRVNLWPAALVQARGVLDNHGNASAASVADLFKGRQFDQEIIVLCVRWYLRYKLSTPDLVEMMAERGVVLVHRTILRWVRYVPEFEKRWSRMRGRLAVRGDVPRRR